ncbi:unnamed protein product, partial [Dibothriocephalus latus]
PGSFSPGVYPNAVATDFSVKSTTAGTSQPPQNGDYSSTAPPTPCYSFTSQMPLKMFTEQVVQAANNLHDCRRRDTNINIIFTTTNTTTDTTTTSARTVTTTITDTIISNTITIVTTTIITITNTTNSINNNTSSATYNTTNTINTANTITNTIITTSTTNTPIITSSKTIITTTTTNSVTTNFLLEPELSASVVWAYMMAQFEAHAHQVIRFARAIPGFRDLPRSDTKVLVQESMYPIVLIQLSRDFNATSMEYNFFNFTPRERRYILTEFPIMRKVAAQLRDAGTFLRPKNMDENEIALLCCIVFLQHCKIYFLP